MAVQYCWGFVGVLAVLTYYRHSHRHFLRENSYPDTFGCLMHPSCIGNPSTQTFAAVLLFGETQAPILGDRSSAFSHAISCRHQHSSSLLHHATGSAKLRQNATTVNSCGTLRARNGFRP